MKLWKGCALGAAVGAAFWGAVFAQTVDVQKLAPIYQMQRNLEADARAQCAAIVIDLQARVADLEKQLAVARTAHKEE